jgi:hypothetical protein
VSTAPGVFLGSLLLVFSALLAGAARGQCDRVKLTAPDAHSTQEFAWAVALDGSRALVGSLGPSADGVTGGAYVFERVLGTWSLVTKLASPAAVFDGFGQTVVLSAGRAIVGARYDDTHGFEAGKVYVYSGATWALEAALTAHDAGADDEFGQSLAADGDRILVGAAYDDDAGDFSGSAYLFERSGSAWTESAKFVAPDASAGQVFGSSVALSGEVAAVGAPGDDSAVTNGGAVYVFRRRSETFVFEQKLLPSDPTLHSGFGNAIALSGGALLVGSFGDDEAGENAGSAYVFRHDGAAWVEEAKLLSNQPGAAHVFGHSVGLSGELAVVGSFGDSHGGSLTQAGSAHVFRHDGAGSWNHVLRVQDTTPQSAEYFGFSVAASGDGVLVGSPDDSELGFARGSATALSLHAAGASFHGVGWPGTLGVPTLTNLGPPQLGQLLSVQVGNSLGRDTPGFVLVGLGEAAGGTKFGGTLLVMPALIIATSVPAAGLVLSALLPDAPALCGVTVFLQAIEADPGASHGFAFSPGLGLHLGQ